MSFKAEVRVGGRLRVVVAVVDGVIGLDISVEKLAHPECVCWLTRAYFKLRP